MANKSKVGKTFTIPITFTVTNHEDAGKGSFLITIASCALVTEDKTRAVEIGASPSCSIEISSQISPYFSASVDSEKLLRQIEKAMPKIRKEIGLEEAK